jgi:ribosomal protein L44E
MYKIQTLDRNGQVIFTQTRKTKAAAERYAAQVEAKPMNRKDGVTARVVPQVVCDNCGERHEATPVHVSPTQGQIYEVICEDGLSDFYTTEALV